MKTFKNEKYKSWLNNSNSPQINTRQVPRKLKPVRYITKALGKSSIARMTEIINDKMWN